MKKSKPYKRVVFLLTEEEVEFLDRVSLTPRHRGSRSKVVRDLVRLAMQADEKNNTL